jgi:hypothetical protein
MLFSHPFCAARLAALCLIAPLVLLAAPHEARAQFATTGAAATVGNCRRQCRDRDGDAERHARRERRDDDRIRDRLDPADGEEGHAPLRDRRDELHLSRRAHRQRLDLLPDRL